MNILKKVEDYLQYESEVFGDTLNLPKIETVANSSIAPEETQNVIFRKESIEESQITTSTQEVNMKNSKNLISSESVTTEAKLSSVASDWKESDSLDILYSKISDCMECELGKNRNKFVFGDGNHHADIMVIGEAPGADEDEQGIPFIGRAGKLLTKMLEAIFFKREDIYIANICKCRPPGNRRPTTAEVDSCEPYLKKQIELIKPVFILSLGLTSVDTLLKKKHKMADIRGNIMDYHGSKMLVTYHPAALLRNPQWKKAAWEDLKKLRILYDNYLLNEKK